MGRQKRELERLEGIAQDAIDILLQAGVFTKCEYHDEVFALESHPDLTQAYKIGADRLSDGSIESNYNDFMEIIKSTSDQVGMECPSCERVNNA